MMLHSIRNIKNLKGKTVLLRVDFNVPVMKGRVDATEDFRLVRVVPTIQFLLKGGARVILLSHRGRPEGRVREDLRLTPVAERLRQLLNKELGIRNYGNHGGHDSLFMIHNSKTREELQSLFPAYTIAPGVTMLENLRFDPREEANDADFAKALASMGDIYVNDAFAVSHRKNASVHAITKYLPSYAGLLMEEELQHLSSIFRKPKRPLVVILGGAKISTKIGLVQKFLHHADFVLLGGGLANTLFKFQGHAVGKSLVEDSMMDTLRTLKKISHLVIPTDVAVAVSLKGKKRITAVDGIRKNEAIFDIGPKTVDLFSSLIAKAGMIVWNGPLGYFEEKKFAKSTFDVLGAVLKNKKAKTIIGGGETVTAFRQFQHDSRLPRANASALARGSTIHDSRLFLSTGGGAMLEYMEQGTLPSIEPLLR
ncbi:MAG: phosphoglycerate kinase [bacterium]|nr:phosphoglycerate kinase [bacterium]